jgi:hypothetical protein
MDTDDDLDDDLLPEDHAHFAGPCTCVHEDDDHGWGGCGVDGCDCEAGWEE